MVFTKQGGTQIKIHTEAWNQHPNGVKSRNKKEIQNNTKRINRGWPPKA